MSAEHPTPDNPAGFDMKQPLEPGAVSIHAPGEAPEVRLLSASNTSGSTLPSQAELLAIATSNPRLNVVQVGPETPHTLSPKKLSDSTPHKGYRDGYAVTQDLRGVITAGKETFAVIEAKGKSPSDEPRTERSTILTRINTRGPGQNEVVGSVDAEDGLTVGRQAQPEMGLSETTSNTHFRVDYDKDGKLVVTDLTSLNGTKVIERSDAREGDTLVKLKRSKRISAALGRTGVEKSTKNPFDEDTLWRAKSDEVRELLDDKSEAKTVERKIVDVEPETPVSNLRSDEVSMIRLETQNITEIADRFSRQVADIVRAEVQTNEERSLVKALVDNGSRLIQSGLETGRLELPDDFESSKFFLQLANSVQTPEGKGRTKLTGNSTLDTGIITDAVSRLATGNAETGFNERRLDMRAEDYALAVMKYYAQMIAKRGGLQLSKYEVDTLAYLQAKSDQAAEARKQVAAE